MRKDSASKIKNEDEKSKKGEDLSDTQKKK